MPVSKRGFNFVLFFSTLIFSSCSILYSLSVSYFLTLLYGNTVTIYSLTVGSYMMFLGLGALMFERLNKKFGMDMLLITETALILIAFFAPLLISYIASMEIEYTLKLYLGFGILSLIGVFSGMELPLLMKLGGENISKIIGIDYLGGLTGSLLYVFFFLQERWKCFGVRRKSYIRKYFRCPNRDNAVFERKNSR